MLRFLTAGESHGPELVGIVEGLPAGLAIDVDAINRDLARRQIGVGRSARMRIENDCAGILSGVMNGKTIGAPVAIRIENLDYANWKDKAVPAQTIPRPGHADLAGAVKYGLDDLRWVAERASARETAMRVACGALARQLLAEFEIIVGSHVLEIGGVRAEIPKVPYPELFAFAQASDVAVADEASAEKIRSRIEEVMRAKDTVGGIIEIVALNVPMGLGSHVHWDRKLDGRLAQAVMSIPSVKGVEIGTAFENARRLGTQVQDEIFWEEGSPDENQNSIGPAALGTLTTRQTNRAGGLEGGITNGMPLVIRAALKPISTTVTPLRSVDLATGQPALAEYQRSDFCHVPRACVIGEAMVAWVLADALMEKLGGDSLGEMKARREERSKFEIREFPSVTRDASLVITGFMGTGKTSVGQIIAQKLAREFVDMDEVIASREGLSVRAIFEAWDEEYFRARESELCAELGARDNLIIATGGGALLDSHNREMFAKAFIVCLDASLDAILARLHGAQDRPLLAQGDLRPRVEELLKARQDAYAQIECHIDTTDKSVEQVAAEVLEAFGRDAP